MDYDDIYYLAICTGKNPALMFNKEDIKSKLERELYRKGPGTINKIVDLVIAPPVPRKPVYQDWYSSPRITVSKKVADIFKQVGLYNNQLFEARIVHKDEVEPDIFMFKCNTEINLMHHGRSSFDKPGRFYFIDSLSLDEAVLDKIEEDKRLILLMDEKAHMMLFHERMVQALEAAEVTGVRFVKVKDWNVGSAFD